MIKTLTYTYRKIPNLGKLLLGIFCFLVVSITTSNYLYAVDTIPFSDSLPTMFTGWFNSGNYSNAHFKFGGNDFIGIIFRQGTETGHSELITINGGAQAIQCTEKLRGIYYSNQRGRRIFPLDTGNLAILSVQGTGYETMTMDYGFFTNCSSVSGGYTPFSNDVYGQINHHLSGYSNDYFQLFAGIHYDFTGNTYSGLTFGHTLQITTGGIHTGFIFDSNGGIAELNMNMPWCQYFTVTPNTPPIVINQGDTLDFTCNGSNANGYILHIFGSGNSSPLLGLQVNTTANSYTRTTGSGLATGMYRATCTIQGPGGSGPQCGNDIYFSVGSGTPVGTGCNPNFQGEIGFSPFNGSNVIHPSLATYYTNKTGITLEIGATEPVYYSVSGDFVSTPYSSNFIGTGIYDFSSSYITLLNTNLWNYFGSTYITGSCNYVDAAKRVFVDTLPPTSPYIIAPAISTNICSSTPFTVTRSGSYDSGAGLSHYQYEIYTTSGMSSTGLMLHGTVPNTITSINLNISLLPFGTYYLRIGAVDKVGNTGYSNLISFTSSSAYCTARTGVLIVTPTIRLRNVELSKVYRSDPIWILGLTGPTLLDISKGMLFVNNGTGLGTSGIVTSNDTIYIEVVSSDKYDTTVTSELHILGLTGLFSVTTKKNQCILTIEEKLILQNIYANLKDEYNNDLSKLSDFLNTFQSMVKDESILSNSCDLDYLLSLIDEDIGGGGGGIDTSNHITPNCKEYSIGYDTVQEAYYAPEMINRYYFINRESLIRHLDYYNPGDCHINTYTNNFRTPDVSDPMRHIAPNGKIYHLTQQYGGFSATEFATPKYFDSMDSIIRHIDIKNPPKEIWKHDIDTSFTPIVFAAPNGKEYRIYKTDRGFMSYKLMKVKYYPTLSELKNHINVNNPSKR